MADDSTTIQVSQETWRQLNAQKQSPSETYDDVIQRLLNEEE